MGADRVAASLLRIAAEDLAGAKVLTQGGNRNAIYLLEQAAEKTIRAVLTSESIHAGIGHDLKALVDRIPDENPIKSLLRSTEHLAGFATAYRYPSPEGGIKPSPSPKELESETAKVEAALGEVVRRLGVDLAKANTPATKPGPIR